MFSDPQGRGQNPEVYEGIMFGWLHKLKEKRTRVLIEDTLKHLHGHSKSAQGSTIESVGDSLGISHRKMIALVELMESRGLLRWEESQLCITEPGEQLALQVIRAHRLWEKYLVDEARVPVTDVHTMADRREHSRDPEALSILDASMGYPTVDPHGDPIPTADGDFHPIESVAMTHWPIGQLAKIVHLEDEPVEVFAQIVAQGLGLGDQVQIIESNSKQIVFAVHQETHVITPAIAANIFLATSVAITREVSHERLLDLRLGESAIVHSLDSTLQGYTRRRLLDLGLTKGAQISAEYRSFLGDPVAYRVRGSLIALRKDQAEHVLITTNQTQESGDV